jgi:hypothetical protein
MANIIAPTRKLWLPSSLASVNPAQPVDWGEALNSGLKAQFKMLPSSNIGRDLTARNIGTNYGATLVTSDRGQVAEFNGSSDYVDGGNAHNVSVPFTITAWVQAGSLGNYRDAVSLSAGGSNNGFQLQMTNGNKFAAVVRASGSVSSALSLTSVVANTWFHVAAVFYSSTLRRIAVNGIIENGTTTDLTPATPDLFSIGRLRILSTNYNWWDGLVDDVRVFDHALSDAELWNIYEDSRTGYTRTLNRSLTYFPVAVAEEEEAATVGIAPFPASRSLASVDPAQPVNWGEGLNDGLQFWWLGLPTYSGGGLARDLAKQHDGTLTSMDPATDWVPTPRGDFALDFDGSNDYVSLGTNCVGNLLQGASASCFSLWFYYASGTLDAGYWDNVLFAGSIGNNNNIWINVTGGTKILAGGRSQNGDAFQSTISSGTTVADGWNHCVGILDYSNDTIQISLNGHFDSPAGVSFGSNTYNHTTSSYADAIAGLSSHLDGQISDVRFWNRGLSAAEVRQVYDDSRTGYQRALNRSLRWFPVATGEAPPSGVPWWALTSRSHILGSGIGIGA